MRQNLSANRPVAAKVGTTAAVRLVLSGPERFSHLPRCVRSRDLAFHQRVMNAYDVYDIAKFRILYDLVGNCPLAGSLSRIFIATDDARFEVMRLQLMS